MRLRLASRSPRRAALLEAAGIPFVPGPYPDVEEVVAPGRSPAAAVEALARAKAEAALRLADPGDVVLAADTLVFRDGRPLGKPADAAEARAHLTALSGRTHEVITGLALAGLGAAGPWRRGASSTTRVRFRALTVDEIVAYVQTGEPLDKAGAYALQGGARHFVEALYGAEDTVIGLPVQTLRDLLAGCPGCPGARDAE